MLFFFFCFLIVPIGQSPESMFLLSSFPEDLLLNIHVNIRFLKGFFLNPVFLGPYYIWANSFIIMSLKAYVIFVLTRFSHVISESNISD